MAGVRVIVNVTCFLYHPRLVCLVTVAGLLHPKNVELRHLPHCRSVTD